MRRMCGLPRAVLSSRLHTTDSEYFWLMKQRKAFELARAAAIALVCSMAPTRSWEMAFDWSGWSQMATESPNVSLISWCSSLTFHIRQQVLIYMVNLFIRPTYLFYQLIYLTILNNNLSTFLLLIIGLFSISQTSSIRVSILFVSIWFLRLSLNNGKITLRKRKLRTRKNGIFRRFSIV